MAARRVARTPRRQDPKPFTETFAEVIQGDGTSSGRGQLDGQRHAIKVAADLADDRPVFRRHGKAPANCGGPLDEEVDRGALNRKRFDRPAVLARHPEGFAAGRQHPRPRRGAQHRVDQLSNRMAKVLAVVQDHEQLPRRQRLDERRARRGAWAHHETQRSQHRIVHHSRVRNRRQLADPHPVSEQRQHLCGSLQRQPGLAHPTHARQRDQAMMGQHLRDVGDLRVAAQERAQLRGQVRGRPVQAVQRRKRIGKPRRGDLPHVFGLSQIA